MLGWPALFFGAARYDLIGGVAIMSKLFRMHIGDAPAPPSPPQSSMNSDVQTAEGQIGTVDTDTKTLILVDGDKQVTFDFDDRTAIVESGHAVPPAKIPQ